MEYGVQQSHPFRRSLVTKKMGNSMNKRNQEERRVCGTVLLWGGEIKLWGGHESEEAMHAANGTTPPNIEEIYDKSGQDEYLVNFI
jgi:hypothetical protein